MTNALWILGGLLLALGLVCDLSNLGLGSRRNGGGGSGPSPVVLVPLLFNLAGAGMVWLAWGGRRWLLLILAGAALIALHLACLRVAYRAADER